MIYTERFAKLPFSTEEALRYLGVKGEGEELFSVLEEVRAECEGVLSPAVCYTEVAVERAENVLFLNGEQVAGSALYRRLEGCKRAVLFAATVGVGIDRLLVKYGQTDSFRCALVQAIGTVYAESLCDEFCALLAEKKPPFTPLPRFSPGYGDCPLTVQTQIFKWLCPQTRIGLTLNGSLLMSPSKSVTAIVGLKEGKGKPQAPCADCAKSECDFRKRK